MKVGDLVKGISGELFVITSEECQGHFDVYAVGTGNRWRLPKEFLEVVNAER